MKNGGNVLREGFSTGTAATAAAMAAVRCLLDGKAPRLVSVPLPPFSSPCLLREFEETGEGRGQRRRVSPYTLGATRFWDIEPAFCRHFTARAAALAGIVKDGGDDPDATNGLLIEALVRFIPDRAPGSIGISAGKGVGVATLPGLPVSVGAPAINPVPRHQIETGIALELKRSCREEAVMVRIIVPGGAARARHTLNPRLGILGGISILGTQGTVRPYSHEAWEKTIRQALLIARETGSRRLFFSTGRRSEKFLQTLFPRFPEHAFIQIADYVRSSFAMAASLGFRDITAGFFMGKLLKVAQGVSNTHAKNFPVDMEKTADFLFSLGLERELADRARFANTVCEAFSFICASDQATSLYRQICLLALQSIHKWLGNCGMNIRVVLFSSEGSALMSIETR